MENASVSKKVLKQNKKIAKKRAKARAKYADSLELHTKRSLGRNGWFALSMSILSIVAAVLVLYLIVSL